MKLFKVNMVKMNIKYWKPENEFRCSPPWRACPDFTSGGAGVGLLKNIFTFLVSNILYYTCLIRL